jgi:tetratricopeptide (TPR) repeat protein
LHFKFQPFALCLLLLFCLANSGCQNAQEKAAISARDAELALQAGDLEKAEKLALGATQLRDSEASYWGTLGKIQLQRNKLGEAYFSFQRLVELDPGNLNAIQLVSELAFQANDQKLAEEMADRALVLAPSSTRALLVKGLISLDKGKPEVAKELATKILNIDPKDEFGTVLAARALAVQGDIVEAAQLISRDIEANKRSEASLVTLIELHRRTGDFAALKSSFQNLIAKQPDSLPLLLDYANILYRGGEFDTARSILFRVISDKMATYENIVATTQLWKEFDPKPLSSNNIKRLIGSGSIATQLEVAGHYLDENDTVTAKRLLPTDAKDQTDSIRTQVKALKARVFYIEGRRADAMSLATTVINEDKTNVDARIVRSSIRQSKKDLTGALEDAQVAVENFQESEAARILLTQILLMRDGQMRALQSVAEGLEAMPQSSQMAEFTVKFLLRLKLPERALGVAKQFASDNPSSVRGWKNYMFACDSAGNATCSVAASAGLAYANSVYTIDQRPGAQKKRGLFGDLKINCPDDRGFCR